MISEVVASQVCAMILSATGTLTHNGANNLSWPQGYAFMYFAHVKEANMRVFDTEEELTADQNFSYVNMLPDQAFLANKRPRLVDIEGLEHRTDLLNAKNARNAFRIEVSAKSTRNKMHIAFATICFMWMKTYAEKDRMHSCKSALESYRLQGLHTIGCVRYAEKVGVKRVLLCSRLNGGSCIEDRSNKSTYSVEDIIKSDVCNLIEETRAGRKKVSEGFIHPFLSKIGTLVIPSDEYVVPLTRVEDFSAVYEDGSVDSESSPEPSSGTTGLLSNFLHQTFSWKIARIQRVTVLHNFRKPIGTAILPGRLSDICKENGQSGSDIGSCLEDSNQFPMAASGSAGDHNNLAVICDLQIFPNRPEFKSLCYTFFE